MPSVVRRRQCDIRISTHSAPSQYLAGLEARTCIMITPLRFSDIPPGLRCDTVLVMVTQLFSLYIYWVQLRKHDEIQKTNDFFNFVQNEVKFSDLRGHSLIVRATSCIIMTSLLTHILPGLPLGPKPTTSPLKSF